MEQAERKKAPDASGSARLDFKRVLPLFVIVLVDLLGLTIIIPLMPLYAVSFGASDFTIGLLGAAYPVMQFVGAPLLGRLSDRFGRKPVLIASQIGTLGGFLVLGMADALWLLFAARLIDGLTGGNISVAQAAITDSTDEETRTQALGLIGAAFGLGFIIGPVIAFASLAASGDNYHVPAFVAAGFSLLSILITAVVMEETLPPEKRGAAASQNRRSAFSFAAMAAAVARPEIGILLVLLFAQQLAFGGFEQLLSLFTLRRLGMNGSENSLLLVYVGVLVVAVQGYFIGRWSRALGDRRLIFVGLAALAAGLIVISLTPRQPLPGYSRQALALELGAEEASAGRLSVDIPPDGHTGWLGVGWLMLGMVPLAVGGGALRPTINSLITKRVGGDEIGGILGVSTAFLSAANALAPPLMGALFGLLGATAPFLLGGLLVAALFVLAVQRLTPGPEQHTAPETAGVGG